MMNQQLKWLITLKTLAAQKNNMNFSEKFAQNSPFKNIKEPKKVEEKEEPKPLETPMSESELKLMKATQSKTDKSIREQEYPGKVGVIIGQGAPEMSPLERGGYEGAADTYGQAAYIPTAGMYTDMFNKIGKAVADIEANKKKKDQKDFDKEMEESSKKIKEGIDKLKEENKELESTQMVWDGTKFVRKPITGLTTDIEETTKLG